MKRIILACFSVLIILILLVFNSYNKVSDQLHVAIYSNDVEKVEEILKTATKKEINQPLFKRYMEPILPIIDAGENKYPLQLACEDGRLEIVKLLLEHGADIKVRSREGNESLIFCTLSHNADDKYKVVQLLIEYGADIDETDQEGYSLLFYVCGGVDGDAKETWADRRELFCYLLENGKNLEIKKGEDYRNLFEVASDSYDVFFVQYLIENGYFDVNTVSDKGTTALQVAARYGRVEICRYLLEQGADKTIKNDTGRTAYDYVMERKETESEWKDESELGKEYKKINRELERLLRLE